MIRLTQTFGAHAGRVREFDQDVVRCGRLPTNDLAFDPHADLDASGNHAEIRREPGGRWVLVDAGSRNGTLVNGQSIQRHVLEGNEEIEFGTGGPRVKVEIREGGVPAGALRVAQPTAPATPILPPSAPPPPGDMSPPTGASPGAPVWTSGGPSPASGSEAKRYGQRTLDLAVESAETRGRAAGAGAGSGAIVASQVEVARLTEANKQSRMIIIGMSVLIVLLLGAVCLLGSVLAYFVFRS
ncbi:MAG: FHA domain-containing protein [Sandaracinus sp.]